MIIVISLLFQYVKIARLTDGEDGDKVSSLCMELGNEMEGVEEGAVYIQEVSKTVINYMIYFA